MPGPSAPAVPARLLALALLLAACTDAPLQPASGASGPAERGPAGGDPAEADPPFAGARWRLQSLGGQAPVEGVRPVLLFTGTPAERDTYDRPYPGRFANWRIVNGDLGVGWLHAPYRRSGDSLRFSEVYAYQRLSTAAEEAQAKRLANALEATRTARQDGDRLALLGPDRDTLAVFVADPPRAAGPLDDVEWVLTDIGSVPSGSRSTDITRRPAPDGTRADLTFTSRRLGPGPEDGFDAFAGYTGCNWHSGGYRLARQSVGRFRLETSGPPMATQRGCAEPAASVEDAVLSGLTLATSAETDRRGEPTDEGRTATSLTLRDSAGTMLLAFRRHQPYPVDVAALRRGRWVFASTDHRYQEIAAGVTVAFADSTFRGADGCVRVSGTYRVDGDALAVPTQQSDDSGCSDAERARHHVVPVASGKLAVTAERLVLYDENGTATRFTRPR